MAKLTGKNYFMERLGEASTWRGFLACLTACGVAFSPDQADKIVAAGLAAIGLVGTFTGDKKPKAV